MVLVVGMSLVYMVVLVLVVVMRRALRVLVVLSVSPRRCCVGVVVVLYVDCVYVVIAWYGGCDVSNVGVCVGVVLVLVLMV